MGAWGPAIFSDDFACDVRDDYIAAIVRGKTNEAATEYVKMELLPKDVNDEDYSTFWIALALTQWKNGRLLPEVKEQALLQINSGTALRLWAEVPKKAYEKRRAALEQAKETLLSPMPPAKKIPMPSRLRSDPWQEGDILAYKILRDDLEQPCYTGKYVLLRVVWVKTGKHDVQYAYYAVFAWCGSHSHALDKARVEALPYLKLGEAFVGTPKELYHVAVHRTMNMREIREHEVKVLFHDHSFSMAHDSFLAGGQISGSLAGVYVFDRELAARLSQANITPDSTVL